LGVLLWVVSSLVGCGEHPRCADLSDLSSSADVLLIGDSVFDWNAETCSDVGDFISFALDARIQDRAVGGSWLDHPDEEDIFSSYFSGDWSWVILDGGANDLNESCGCDCPASLLDGLISPELDRGAMPELTQRALNDGARVLLLGYYEPQPGSEFEGCLDELEILSARYAALAETTPELTFVDARGILDPVGSPEAYAADGIHLSELGSGRIAQALLEFMANDT
jgi:hypothetical protein